MDKNPDTSDSPRHRILSQTQTSYRRRKVKVAEDRLPFQTRIKVAARNLACVTPMLHYNEQQFRPCFRFANARPIGLNE